jgi:hypothetical protein
MGQFKPMVKMMTTEPSIELKLKKGGAVKKADGGMMAAPLAAPARGGMMPAARPMRPSMAARRRAMAVPPAVSMPPMKKGGKAEMETPAMHKAEMFAIKGVDKKLEKHAAKPASKAHKGLATGGVVMGQGGYKKGGSVKMAEGGLPKSGIINTEGQGGEYRNTKMVTAQGEDHTPKKTGEVRMGNAGGYKKGGNVRKYAKGGGVEGNVSGTPPGVTNTTTGEVKLGNAGGYKKGGSAKKFARGGAVNDSGNVVKMPQGQKKPSAPVSINALSGTFKKGGKVKKYEGGGQVSNYERERMDDLSKGAYDRFYSDQKKENEAMRDTILGAPGRAIKRIKGFFGGVGDKPDLPSGSVTKTEKSVTVTPAKKRGGAVKC